MREDQLEALEKNFPTGYVILYRDAKGQVRITKYLPDHSNECAELEANYQLIVRDTDHLRGDKDASNVHTS